MKKILLITICFLVMCATNSFAQDPQFTQFYANRIYLNPAYAGSKICPTLMLGYRNQAPALKGNFVTTSISYDKYVPQIKGGIGVMIMEDQNGEGNLTLTTVNLMYSYVLNINRTTNLRVGFQASYFQNTINWNKLKFADMVDYKQADFSNSTNEFNTTNNFGAGVDLAAGGIITHKNIYAGVAVNHLTKPTQFIFGDESRLARSFVFHSGGIFDLKTSIGKVALSPNVLVQHQGKFNQINLGLYATRELLTIGIWYRHNDAVALCVGISQKKYKIGYSYDVNISRSRSSISSGAHEISMAYNFKCKRKFRKYQTAVCPQF